MTFTSEVSAEEAVRLQSAAAERGKPVSDYLLTLARQEFQARPPVPADSTNGQMSNYAEPSAEEFGKIMDEKQRALDCGSKRKSRSQ